MKTRLKTLPVALGAILVLGLPPALLLTTGFPLGGPAAVTPEDPLKALVAEQSNLEKLYVNWQAGYLAAGGDRNVRISVGWSDDLSTEPSGGQGWVNLDMTDGRVRARIAGLRQPADLWLVEDGAGPGMSVQPEAGDRMVRIGRLNRDGAYSELAANLGPEFFRDFWLDLVVVSRAGETPAKSSVLLGTRSYFERVYTRTRLESEKLRPGLFGPASLTSLLFSPRLAEANPTQILISHGLVGSDVGQGADLFFRGTFSGNGRTCGTCHRVELNQELDADFIATLPANDKLFVAEFPVNQGGVPGLERPALMRAHGLILENVDGLENPTVKFTMRGVPHSLSLATSILAPNDGRAPVERTGWSGDGAPQTGALRFFPVGAVRQHFPKRLNRVANVDFVLPTSSQLDKMAAFSLASGRLNDLVLSNVTLTNAGAQAGKVKFVSAAARCNGCHANAGGNVAAGTNNNFNTGVETVFNPARTIENFPFDGGFGTANRDCDGNNVNDCFGDGTFNSVPLIEAADTPPFFHNNVAETIEDAITFFTTAAFANSPAGGGAAIPLTVTEIDNIGKFLRVINAAFNNDIAIQRTDAALSLEFQGDSAQGGCPDGGGDEGNSGDESDSGESTNCGGGGDDPQGRKDTVDELLRLANEEAQDAIDVLAAKGLHSDARTLLQSGINKGAQAINENATFTRVALIQGALSDFLTAMTKYGSGLNLTRGEGNLLF
ncbi:MAG TPA: hypothetical protein VF179_08720 [Thermoanaerobaculia bacterium]|nr:hypothetical protein [Thermoanaerobaculia bacterium]